MISWCNISQSASLMYFIAFAQFFDIKNFLLRHQKLVKMVKMRNIAHNTGYTNRRGTENCYGFQIILIYLFIAGGLQFDSSPGLLIWVLHYKKVLVYCNDPSKISFALNVAKFVRSRPDMEKNQFKLSQNKYNIPPIYY